MASTLLLLTIAIPWAGALIIWLVGDEFTKLLHGIAVAFSVAAGIAALLLIPYATGAPIISVDAGPVFGVFTFAPDGLGVFLAAVATVIGSLAVIFSVDYMKGEGQIARYYAFRALLHWQHGRTGSYHQPPADLRLLGNHGAVFLCPDRLP